MIPNTFDSGLLDLNGGTVDHRYIGSRSTTLTWMCRMLGYQSYNSYTNSPNYEWMQNYPVRYYQLECTGSVVPQCRYQEANGYSYSNSLWLRCNARTQLGDTTSFHLVDKDNQHTQKGHGLLMYNGGTVSGNKFDETTAELICRIMGYDKVMSWTTGRKYQFQEESLPIKYKDLNCLESEDVFPLCVYGTDTTGETHDNDVWLWCALPKYNDYRLVCPPGQRRASSNTCYECSANTYSPEPSETSSCLSCPTNSKSLAGSTYCSCNDDTYMSSDRDECLECPGNSTSVKESYPTNFTSLVGPTYCSCNDDTYMSPDGDECLECPGNSTSVKGSTQCACIAGTYLYSDLSSCTPCSNGTVSKEGGTAPTDCVPCPTGSVPQNNGQVCSCEKGYGWEWNSSGDGSCKACPANFFKDKEQRTCMRCPHEATSLPLSEECHCPSGLSWDGESCVNCTTPGSSSGVCNCLAGTYWNEDSNQCEPCPENHFSGQFSSVCSKCPIFTVSESHSFECSSCPKGYSWESHACTECPENHVGNGATCSICPQGTSPSKDKTICQKSSVDILSVVSIALSVVIFTMVVGIILYIWKEKRARIVMDGIKMAYKAEPSTS